MPVIIDDVEYITTQEAADLLGVMDATWRKFAKTYHLKHYSQLGKGKVHLWKKSDVESLPRVMPANPEE